MLTRDLFMEKLSDLEQDYCDFLVTHFAQWDVRAQEKIDLPNTTMLVGWK